MPKDVKVIETLDIPLKVDLKDLHDPERGRLLSQEEAQHFEDVLKEFPPGRYSKDIYTEIEKLKQSGIAINATWPKGVPAPYGIHKEKGEKPGDEGRIFAVYLGKKHGKELGAGAFGKVKLAQDIKTGEWSALKVQVHKEEGYKEMFQDEYDTLEAVQASRGGVAVRKNKSYFTMDYFKGMELYKFLCTRPKLSAIQWLDIGLQAAESVERIHQQNYIHRDIKPQNIVYDPVTGKVQVIDLGIAVYVEKGGKVCRGPAGTDTYWAPELWEAKYDQTNLDYTTKIDIFALGRSLQQIYGFAFLVEESLSEFATSSPLVVNEELKTLLKKMTAENPKDRPDLDDVIIQLQKFRQKLLPVFPITTGVVQISDYLNAKNKKAFIAALKSVDSIILADSDENGKNAVHYTEMRRIFEKEGIRVRKEVLISPDPDALVAQASVLLSLQQDPGKAVISHVCYFHSAKSPGPAQETGAQSIAVTSRFKNYRNEVDANSVRIPEAQIEKVVAALDDQIKRCRQEKSFDNPELVLLEAAVKSFNNNKGKGHLTFSQLHQQLNTLEKKILEVKKPSAASLFIKPRTARVVHALAAKTVYAKKQSTKMIKEVKIEASSASKQSPAIIKENKENSVRSSSAPSVHR